MDNRYIVYVMYFNLFGFFRHQASLDQSTRATAAVVFDIITIRVVLALPASPSILLQPAPLRAHGTAPL